MDAAVINASTMQDKAVYKAGGKYEKFIYYESPNGPYPFSLLRRVFERCKSTL
jgi:hypothetical protein